MFQNIVILQNASFGKDYQLKVLQDYFLLIFFLIIQNSLTLCDA